MEAKTLDFAPWVLYSFVYFYCSSKFVCYYSLDTVVRFQGNFRRVAGALNLRSSNKVDPAIASPSYVVNINIKPVTRVLLSRQKAFRFALCHPQTPRAQNRRLKRLAVSGLRAHVFELDDF